MTEGVVLSVDPSIGSVSSMPAFAIYRAGQLVTSGVWEMDPTSPLPSRLQRLSYLMRKLIKEYDPDVLVHEAISDVPFKGFAGRGHASLQKALGAILSVSGPDKYVGMLPATWKKFARSHYVKSDENDAKEIGWVAIEQARLIIEQEPLKKKRKPRVTKSL